MATLNHPITVKTEASVTVSPFAKYINWANNQEDERLLWTGLGLGLHGCVITPFAFLVVVMSGINFFLLSMVMLGIVSVLVVNLAALPTKYTISAFFISLVIDISVIAACAASGFNIH
jgi:hypothetical protein